MLIGDLGEEALLKELRALFVAADADLSTGMGDDAAVINYPVGEQGVWTTDLLLEGVHFKKAWQSPHQLGRKSLTVNLSDIASMGATPRFALLSLACPPATSLDYILEFCRGFAAMAAETGVVVIGGDTTASVDGITISVTLGGYIPKGDAILRSGAKVGDAILVTGFLGSAAAGLRLLRDARIGIYPELEKAFVDPEPRIAAGKAAVEAGATAMTDISDGLASDLRHICEESGVGAMVEPGLLPSSPDFDDAVSKYSWERESMLLSGGEDYELLFTLPGDIAQQVKALVARQGGIAVTIIGEVMPLEYGIRLVDKAGCGRTMPEHGYEHFSGNI